MRHSRIYFHCLAIVLVGVVLTQDLNNHDESPVGSHQSMHGMHNSTSTQLTHDTMNHNSPHQNRPGGNTTNSNEEQRLGNDTSDETNQASTHGERGPDGHGKKVVDDGQEGGHGGHDARGPAVGGHYGFFHLTSKTILLFQEWTTSTWQEVLGACFAFGCASILYEGLKALRHMLLINARKSTFLAKSKPTLRQRMCSCMHLLQTFLHIVQGVYAYMLMLAFMTFNVWICTAIALGSGFGYFFFGVDQIQGIAESSHCS